MPLAFEMPMKLIWNASPSVPTGLYWLLARPDLKVGDLVVISAPPALADFLSERGYLPVGAPLLKHVAALSGEVVCRAGLTISIDGQVVGSARRSDRLGRPMPVWQGCQRVGSGDIFLMNADAPISLDGRYFGPISRTSIVGHAIPIWLSAAETSAANAMPLPPAHRTKPSINMPAKE
jgi:conjugative transfer signal peptidase TraF